MSDPCTRNGCLHDIQNFELDLSRVHRSVAEIIEIDWGPRVACNSSLES